MVYVGQIGQTFYAQEMGIAVPGQIIGMGNYVAKPYLNAATGIRPVYTVTPPATVDASTTYSLTFDGLHTVSFTTGGSTTTAQLGAGLFAAIRAAAQVTRLVDSSLNAGTGVITLTGRFFNVAVAITSPTNATTTNDLTIATQTAPGTGVEIPFGRFVGRTSADTVDLTNNLSSCRLINSTSGFTVLGVSLKAYLEKNAIGPNARTQYKDQMTVNVIEDTLGIDGVWVECVESNIVPGNAVYVAVGAGNEGRVTTTSSGTIDLTARARYVTGTQTAPDGRLIVGVSFRRF